MADIMSREKRSALMSRIRGKDTGIERTIAAALAARGLEPERHARDLPGTPDFVFRDLRLAVFVDGDFWHGWRFPAWEHKLTPRWKKKIADTRRRDRRNFARLRRAGWRTVRLWEHQIEADAEAAVAVIFSVIEELAPTRSQHEESEPAQ
jgi:DNA mismatch endonuclease (patch repair protein)